MVQKESMYLLELFLATDIVITLVAVGITTGVIGPVPLWFLPVVQFWFAWFLLVPFVGAFALYCSMSASRFVKRAAGLRRAIGWTALFVRVVVAVIIVLGLWV